MTNDQQGVIMAMKVARDIKPMKSWLIEPVVHRLYAHQSKGYGASLWPWISMDQDLWSIDIFCGEYIQLIDSHLLFTGYGSSSKWYQAQTSSSNHSANTYLRNWTNSRRICFPCWMLRFLVAFAAPPSVDIRGNRWFEAVWSPFHLAQVKRQQQIEQAMFGSFSS